MISKNLLLYTCLVLAALIAAIALINHHSKQQSALQDQEAVTEKATVTEKGQTLQVSDLPSTFLETIDTSSDSAVTNTVKSRVPLVLDNTTLTIGPVGGNRSVTIATSKLTLINGARIVTNGNNLSLIANEMDFNSSGGIDSFSDETSKASTGNPGSDGGSVEIYATKTVFGSIRVSLPGQAGADGKPGIPGQNGIPGPRGNNGVDGFMNCAHGGTDGGQGATGGTGGVGGDGTPGGNGGDLQLRGEAVKDQASHFSFQAPPGPGGTGGPGGAGGDGGPGGEGGSGSSECGGGHGGPKGAPGQPGGKGNDGPSGKSSGKLSP